MEKDLNQLEIIIKTWLQDPLDRELDTTLVYADQLLATLQAGLQQDTGAGKTLGPLIGQVRGMQKKLRALPEIDWYQTGKGQLAIGHKPGQKLITDLKLLHTGFILTLLCESEGALEIKQMATRVGIQWLWFPMTSADPPTENRLPEIRQLFDQLADALDNQARVYIHCSAGIHRTGMITYLFLRYTGLSADAARQTLQQLRQETWQAVGTDRLQWADQFVVRLLVS